MFISAKGLCFPNIYNFSSEILNYQDLIFSKRVIVLYFMELSVRTLPILLPGASGAGGGGGVLPAPGVRNARRRPVVSCSSEISSRAHGDGGIGEVWTMVTV